MHESFLLKHPVWGKNKTALLDKFEVTLPDLAPRKDVYYLITRSRRDNGMCVIAQPGPKRIQGASKGSGASKDISKVI